MEELTQHSQWFGTIQNKCATTPHQIQFKAYDHMSTLFIRKGDGIGIGFHWSILCSSVCPLVFCLEEPTNVYQSSTP